MHASYRKLLIFLGLILATVFCGQLQARDLSHDEAQRLQQQGKILPLATLLKKLKARHPGRVLEVELERKGKRYIYEIELIDKNGVVLEFEFDAATGELLRQKRE